MKIYNQDKTQELFDIDETKGKLIPDRLLIHHDAVKAEAGVLDHYEVIKEYPNGGKDVKEIWKVEPKAGKEAWDETQDILVYIPYTAEELAQIEKEKRIASIREQIDVLKNLLASWDYKTSKYADGEYTEEEWTEIITQRKAWREEINRLEAEWALYV